MPSTMRISRSRRTFVCAVVLCVLFVVALNCFNFGIASAGAPATGDRGFGLATQNNNKTVEPVAYPVSSKHPAAGISETSNASSGAASTTVYASDAQTTSTTVSLASAENNAALLSSAPTRDVERSVEAIEAAKEQARLAAEEQARIRELERIAAAQAAKEASAAQGGCGVWEVDFSVGRTAFIDEWTERINKYLEGSPLSGFGTVFAEAAWENAVDPRWSPAIANTESSRGAHCFSAYNAWGWMETGWCSNWVDAINAHVKGLSKGYGYTISLANAKTYCPPNYRNWFSDTLSEMSQM